MYVSNVLDVLVPITRFNRGEANKVFDEVREAGCKVVVKNNTPTCVLLAPERYREIIELIDDQYLIALAEEREKHDSGITYSAEEVYKRANITPDDFGEIPMEYGVDFE